MSVTKGINACCDCFPGERPAWEGETLCPSTLPPSMRLPPNNVSDFAAPSPRVRTTFSPTPSRFSRPTFGPKPLGFGHFRVNPWQKAVLFLPRPEGPNPDLSCLTEVTGRWGGLSALTAISKSFFSLPARQFASTQTLACRFSAATDSKAGHSFVPSAGWGSPSRPRHLFPRRLKTETSCSQESLCQLGVLSAADPPLAYRISLETFLVQPHCLPNTQATHGRLVVGLFSFHST